MTWDETLTRLRDALTRLYPDMDRARALLDVAGVRQERVRFDAAAQLNWHAILKEAHLQRTVGSIAHSAANEYPLDEELRDAVAAYETRHGLSSATDPMPAVPSRPPPAPVDLAIVTAMPEELDPVLNLIGRERWSPFTVEQFKHHAGQFECAGGVTLVVSACSLWKYGGGPTIAAVIRLRSLQPRLIAMTGICAGWEGKDGIEVGDVIVADRAFAPGEGKRTGRTFQADTQTYQPPPWLVQQIREFAHGRGWDAAIQAPRPRSLRFQSEWLLCQLAGLTDPTAYPTNDDWAVIRAQDIDYVAAKERLYGRGWIDASNGLTDAGRAEAARLRAAGKGVLGPRPDRDHRQTFVGAFASETAVVAVDHPFKERATRVRTVRAIDLEIQSLFAVAAELAVPAMAVKGVSDYGTQEKEDSYHEYAAEASARWLHAFIHENAQHWPPR